MQLFKRGNIYWAWIFGKRVTTRCTGYEAAKAVALELERRAANPKYRAAHETTIERALELMLDEHGREASPETVKFYRQKAAHLVRLCGREMPLADIDAGAVDRYITARIAEGASRHSVHKELTTLRLALKYARRRGDYEGDPLAVLPVGFSAEYKPRETWLTREQAEALLYHLEPERAAHVAFVLATGAERGAAFRARRSDVGPKTVRLRGTKTEYRDATVPIVELVRPLLERALRDAPGKDVLFDRWPNARRDILRACERAGVPEVTWNDLRRSYSTWLVRAGVDLHHLARLMRHGSPQMVFKVYGRLDPEALGELVDGAVARRGKGPEGGSK